MLPDPLTLFLELAALPSPPGEERAVADRVLAYLAELGLDVSEDGAGAVVGSTIGNLYCRLEPTPAGLPLFFCAHLDTVPPSGPLEPVVEDGWRAQRGRDDPRRRQQGSGRVAARGGAPCARGRPAARGDRAALHAEGGGRAARRRGVRREAACCADRLRLRPAGADRRDRARRADPAVASCDVPRARGSRGDGSRRTAAPRSPPLRVRSPTCGSGGSTRRRRRTSA